MDGLEAVEIRLSDLEFTKRIDSEYYKPSLINKENNILAKSYSTLNELSKFVIGPFGSAFQVENFTQNTKYRYIRGKDVKSFNVLNNDNVYIPEVDYIRLEKYALHEKDLLVSVVGTLGNVAIVDKEDLPAIFSCKSTVIRCNNKVNPYYLLAFLNTETNKNLLLRKARGTVQTGLNLDDLKSVLVLNATENFQKFIEKVFLQSLNCNKEANQLYKQAENLLLSELGLHSYVPSNEKVAVKTLSESFGISGRLDAEYYQPKYDELKKYLEFFKQVKIKDIIKYPVSSGATPKVGGDDYTDSINGIPFIRAVDLKEGRVETSNFIYIKNHVHQTTLSKTQLKKYDVLFSIAGTVGRCALFDHDIEANINQAISILRFDENILKRLYLITYFNSRIGQIYISKFARQGLQTNLNLKEVSNLKIPLIDMEKQNIIVNEVQKSFSLKDQSRLLLEAGKEAVEMAIEISEEAATKYLEMYLID